VVVGLRLAVGKAVRGAVTADVLLSISNLGKVLVSAQATFNISLMLAAIVLVLLLGLVLMRLAEWLERRILAWQSV
jgi:ABC-type nitrate/sulfonate/bicarbonate transport system permease component